jgi:hypothetical protein
MECSVGLEVKGGSCEGTVPFTFLASLESYPYSNIVFRMIMLQFMEELWFYEYQAYNYSITITRMLKYVGNVNRNRYIPPYVKDIVPDLHQAYMQKKDEWGFSDGRKFTRAEFLEKEKEGINFTVNCSKMYLWNYLLCLMIFLVQRLTYCFFARY